MHTKPFAMLIKKLQEMKFLFYFFVKLAAQGQILYSGKVAFKAYSTN